MACSRRMQWLCLQSTGWQRPVRRWTTCASSLAFGSGACCKPRTPSARVGAARWRHCPAWYCIGLMFAWRRTRTRTRTRAVMCGTQAAETGGFSRVHVWMFGFVNHRGGKKLCGGSATRVRVRVVCCTTHLYRRWLACVWKMYCGCACIMTACPYVAPGGCACQSVWARRVGPGMPDLRASSSKPGCAATVFVARGATADGNGFGGQDSTTNTLRQL
jgi:hypothetical protein